mmetsp:Transcript_67047/g.190207  ORF Transcript_67047/g.190207 Transcript_67047/m.190207 type:complete len:238 (-) Transcript_67047:58-771(-)
MERRAPLSVHGAHRDAAAEQGLRRGRLPVPHRDDERRLARAGLPREVGPVLEEPVDGRDVPVPRAPRDGRPPVAWGARHGHVSAIDRLLEHGANLSRESRTGQTALVVAVRYRQAAAAQALLGRGIAVGAVDAQRRTPLHHAAAAGMRAAVDLLVGARVSISAQDSQGRTAVDEAARRDSPGVVQRLLDGAGREAGGLAGRALLALDAEEAHADVAGAAGPETRRVLEGALRQDREL